ncbi:dTDP-4-dehydrorhamnose reductase [candidate division WOR-3 bacterium]|nr:dTDP-4-dehydrorhamnose reductase [candidate division WOR-3 bacterium]
MKTILLTGGAGVIASELSKHLSGYRVISPGKNELDVARAASVNSFFRNTRADMIVHSAALTDVDYCQNNPQEAMRVNLIGTENLFPYAENKRFLFFSTDYVFDGKSERPYTETDKPNPISVYGKSKYAAEKAVNAALSDFVIVRTSWLLSNSGGFLKKISNLYAQKNELFVVNDIKGSPTVIDYLCLATIGLLESSFSGTVNVANSGEATWYEVAKEYFSLINADPGRVKKAVSPTFSEKAPRPKYSVLDCSLLSSLIECKPPGWKTSLKKHLSGKNVN